MRREEVEVVAETAGSEHRGGTRDGEPTPEPTAAAADEAAADEDAEDRSTTERLRELGSYIKEQRSRAQYSLRHLARVAGVSNPYLSQIERGLRKPSAEILQGIAKALKISSETLYVKAGLLDEPDDLPDLELAILREDSLSERQRAALMEIYRSFRLENERGGTGDAEGADADDADEREEPAAGSERRAGSAAPQGDGQGSAAG